MKVAPYTMLLVGVAVVIVLLGAAGIAGGTQVTCVGCHREYAQGWSATPHAEVGCYLCHQRPGLVGIIEQRTRMLIMVRETLMPGVHEPALVPNAHCTVCHGAVLEEVIEANGIMVRHHDIIEQGRRCTDCHNMSTHGSAIQVPRGPVMGDCMHCHTAIPAAGECDVCHVPGERRDRPEIRTSWQITHGPTWRYTHSMGDRSTCRTCHLPGYCIRCHGIDLPHPPAWNNLHGGVSRAVPQSCESCHESSLCSGCHPTEMPHPDGFLPAHLEQASGEGRQACLDCHLEVGCDACHAAHDQHPELAPEHSDVIRSGVSR